MSGNNILVIEDDGSAAKMIMDVLESEGYAVFSASTKAVAVELAAKTKPSLVFINAILADASGLEITRAIREIDELKEVPFVMLTEMQEEFNERYKSTYGIIGFLRKPVDANELVAKTASIIPLEGEAEAPRDTEDIGEPAEDVWGSDEFEEESAGEDLSHVEAGGPTDELASENAGEDGRIKIKLKVKGDEEFERDLGETVQVADHPLDEGMLEQTAHENPKDKEDLFAGVEDDMPDGMDSHEASHPLDQGLVEQTAHEPEEPQDDMFSVAQEAVDSFKEEIGGEKGPGGHGVGPDVGNGPEEKEFQITDESFESDMQTRLQDVKGDDIGETIKEDRPSAKGVPEGAKAVDETPKAKGKKIDDMDFDEGGIDAGADVEDFEAYAPVVNRGSSKTIKIIGFGLLGILLVAAATWFALDYFGSDKKSGLQIRAIPVPQVQQKKEPVREVAKPEAVTKAEQQSVAPPEKPVDKPVVEKPVEKNVEPPEDTVVTAKQEVKKPVQPVKKKPAPVVKAKYSVQIGFFGEVSNAKNLYNKMKKKGYPVTIKKDRLKNKTVYRVLIGRYNSRDAAYRMITKIKKIEKMDAALHKL